MTPEQFSKTRWGAGMKVLCKPSNMKYEAYVADVVSVDFDQCLIGVLENTEDDNIRWFRYENCEIVNP